MPARRHASPPASQRFPGTLPPAKGHDPDGDEAWGGVLRVVAYVRVELDHELASDPLLPEVGWSWLTEALEQSGE